MTRTKSQDLPGHVLITGGTGFIGTALAERCLESGIRVTVLTRDRRRALAHFKGRVAAVEELTELHGDSAPEVVVNLAGKNLASERWNARVRQALIDSRVGTTERVIAYIAKARRRPALLISGSAVGYYGARGGEALTESDPPGEEYQSLLCRQWEDAALKAERYGVRVCISRTGAVMGPGGGPLSGLTPAFRKGLGAVAGPGDQWISWIHLDDLIAIFLDFMRDRTASGPFNNTAPQPVTNRALAGTLGELLSRPVLLRVPGWVLRVLMGEMAHLYLTGQKVIPERHLQARRHYRYPDIRSALRAALAGDG
ncbi:MAG: TIGR01777 family oxidoreductase [Chromatiales bacterium]|jgi:uncharacterized protein (TIGR01777 family)